MLKKIYLEYVTHNSKTRVKFWGAFSGIGCIEMDSLETDDNIETCKSREDYYVDLFLNRMRDLKTK